MSYTIEFAESVKQHLKSLTSRERSVVFESIEEQLLYEPLIETRNRKKLRPNPIAPWELRIGSIRVFYEVVAEYPEIVRILAVGKKEGNTLFIGRQDIELDETN